MFWDSFSLFHEAATACSRRTFFRLSRAGTRRIAGSLGPQSGSQLVTASDMCSPVSVRKSVVAGLPQSIVAGFLKLFAQRVSVRIWREAFLLSVVLVPVSCKIYDDVDGTALALILCAQVTRSQVPLQLDGSSASRHVYAVRALPGIQCLRETSRTSCSATKPCFEHP